jgi:hypothetical protein
MQPVKRAKRHSKRGKPACAEEVRYGQVVRQTAVAYQTATDAAFLIEIGIMSGSLLTSRQTVQ